MAKPTMVPRTPTPDPRKPPAAGAARGDVPTRIARDLLDAASTPSSPAPFRRQHCGPTNAPSSTLSSTPPSPPASSRSTSLTCSTAKA